MGTVSEKKLLLQLATDTRLSKMKRQDARFKTEARGKWHTYVSAGQRSCEKALTNKYKYVAFLHIMSLSPAPLISLLPQIKGPVDCRHLVTLHIAALIEKHISSSLLFPICYYPLLEITPPKLQNACHTNTHRSAGRAASQELSLIHLRKNQQVSLKC